MRNFEFTLWLADDPRDLDEWSDALYHAGADDCTAGLQRGKPFAIFQRQTGSLEDAIRSAHQHAQTAGLRVLCCG